MGRALRIGAVARETGLSIDAIRYYEKERLLNRAPRTQGGFRIFTDADVQSLRFVRRAQSLGFSLHEIRDMLAFRNGQTAACAQVRRLIGAKLAGVRTKIRELQALECELAIDLEKCSVSITRRAGAGNNGCPVLDEIAGSCEAHE